MWNRGEYIMFIIDGVDWIEFNTYSEAEVFCGENGLLCEDIYEV